MSKASTKAYAIIRGMILSGELASGAQLSEEALALRCQVSRTPVREALRRLEAELLVRRNESQRTFVAEWSLTDIEDAFELRAILEGRAAERAAERVTPLQLEQLKHHNRQIIAAISKEKPDIPTFLEHNRAFHAVIIESADSLRLATILAQLTEQPVVWRTAHNYDRENLLRSHHEHEELLAAFARHDGRWASSIMSGHIRRAFYAYADAHQTDTIDRQSTAA